MTIILGGDSLNKTFFFLKEPDARNLFFFHNSRELFLGPPRCRVRQDGDSAGELGLSFVFCLIIVNFVVVVFICLFFLHLLL